MDPALSVPLRDLLRLTVGKTASLALPSVKRFAIISSGRAGSNLLTSLMRSHPRVFQHGEIFGEHQLERQLVRTRVNWKGPAAYLDDRLRRMTTEEVTGVKILYGNFEHRYGVVRGIPGTEKLLPHMLEDDTLRIIHLRRLDKLALLISLRLANQYKNWNAGSYGDVKVTLPEAWLKEQLAWFEAWENRIAEYFPQERLFDLTYEDLAQNTEATMASLFDFLGVEAAPVATRMRKQNTRSTSDVVENFEALRQSFSGTRYASLFDHHSG